MLHLSLGSPSLVSFNTAEEGQKTEMSRIIYYSYCIQLLNNITIFLILNKHNNITIKDFWAFQVALLYMYKLI